MLSIHSKDADDASNDFSEEIVKHKIFGLKYEDKKTFPLEMTSHCQIFQF